MDVHEGALTWSSQQVTEYLPGTTALYPGRVNIFIFMLNFIDSINSKRTETIHHVKCCHMDRQSRQGLY